MSTSIFMIAMESIRDAIKDLSLTGLDDSRVKVRRQPHDGEHLYPGITIHPLPEIYHIGTNERENVGYGCGVTMVVNNDNDEDYKLDRLLLWRETIRRKFVEDVTLTDVSTCCTIKVEHGHVLDWKALQDENQDVSSLVLRVYSLETRT